MLTKKTGVLLTFVSIMAGIVLMVFANLSSQVDPGFRVKHSVDNNWVITQSDYESLDVGTEIAYLRVDGHDYAIQPEWLMQSVVTLKTDDELTAFLDSERFLRDAIGKSVSLVDIDDEQYAVSFKSRSVWDTSLYFWLHPLLAVLCVSLALWAFFIGRLSHFHVINVIAALFYSVSVMVAISSMDRLWAVSPELLYDRFALGNLCMRVFTCAYLYLLWNIPYRLGQGSRYQYIPLAVFALYLLTWSSQFLGVYQQVDLLVIKVIFVGGCLVIIAMYLQWRLASRGDSKQLVNQIALRWMFTTIGVCTMFGFGYNMMWQMGYADGKEADLINLAVTLLFKMGVTALLLKHLLYKLETWWWRAWGIFGGLTLCLCTLIVSAELFFGYEAAALWVAALMFVAGYFLISAYFRYRYAKYDAKMMERSVPKLVNVATSFDEPQQANQLWCDLLKKTFNPQYISLISDHQVLAPLFPHERQNSQTDNAVSAENRMTLQADKPRPAMILQEGEQMLVQGLSGDGILLTGAASGMRLFTQRDISRVSLFWQVASQSRRVQQAFLEGESSERKRIAADLHDDIGGKLLYLSSVQGKFGNYARETLDDLRTLTRGLSSGEKLLSELVADINYSLAERCEVADVSYVSHLELDAVASHPVPARSATMLSSVLSELLRNALQHEGVSHIELSISSTVETLYISFENDGELTDPSTWKTGLGTVSMKRRVNEVAGYIEWMAREQGGVVCKLSWPIKHWLSLP